MEVEYIEYFLFVLFGFILIYVGVQWKKPNYGGGIVHKYGLIILGLMSLIYGLISLF